MQITMQEITIQKSDLANVTFLELIID